MIDIPNEENDEPAMRFEGLVMFAYDCDRLEDPEGFADASVFDGEFIPKVTDEGLRIMGIVLDQLIDKSSGYLQKELQSLRDSLSIDIIQDNAIELIDSIIQLFHDNESDLKG